MKVWVLLIDDKRGKGVWGVYTSEAGARAGLLEYVLRFGPVPQGELRDAPASEVIEAYFDDGYNRYWVEERSAEDGGAVSA